jgi:CubicO group peptidase (beta-lactamase class C family)
MLVDLAAALGGHGCVIHKGASIHRWGVQTERYDMLSSAKPVLSTLLFFAIHEGLVESVDTPLTRLGWDLEPKDRAMTLRHLANMVSGYARPDPPGEAFAYNDYAINLYQKTLFDRIFRADPATAANHPNRLGALGLEDGLRFRETNRRISVSVRDFARIAWFWLRRGEWNGKQLLPRHFFDGYQKPQLRADLPHTRKAATNDYLNTGTYGGGSDHFTEFGAGIYGFNWWFNARGRLHPDAVTWPSAPAATFMSIGAGGNNAVMVPPLEVALVSMRGNWGNLQPGDPDSRFNRHIELLCKAVA